MAELFEAIPISIPLANPPTHLLLVGEGLPFSYLNLRLVFTTPGTIVELGPGPEMTKVNQNSNTTLIQVQLRFVTTGLPIFKLPGVYDVTLLSDTGIIVQKANILIVESNAVTFALSRLRAQQDELVPDLQLTIQGVAASEVRRLKFVGSTTLNIDSLTPIDLTRTRVSPFFLHDIGFYTARLFADTTEFRQLGGDLINAFEILQPARIGLTIASLSKSLAQPDEVLAGIRVLGEGFIAAESIKRIRLVSPVQTITFLHENRTDVSPVDPIAAGLFRIIDNRTILLAQFTVASTATFYGIIFEKLEGATFVFVQSAANILEVRDTKVSTVVFTPAPGLYCAPQTIGLAAFNTDDFGNPTTPDTTARIYFSFDIPPTLTSGNLFPPPTPITVKRTSVLWAIVVDAAGNTSQPISATYIIGFIQARDVVNLERLFLNFVRAINTNEMIQALRVKYTAVLKDQTVPGVRLVAPGNLAGNSTLLMNLRKGIRDLLHNVGLSIAEVLSVPLVQFVSDVAFKLTLGREVFVVAQTLVGSGPRLRLPGNHHRVGRRGEEQFDIVFRGPGGFLTPPDGVWTVALLPSTKGISYFDVWVFRSNPVGPLLKYEGNLTPTHVATFPGLEAPAHIIATFTVTSGKIVPASIANIPVGATRTVATDFTDPTVARGDGQVVKDIHWRELEICILNAVLPAEIPLPEGDDGVRTGDPTLAARVGESPTAPPNFIAPNSLGDVPIPDIIEVARTSTAQASGGPFSINTAFKFNLEGQGLKRSTISVTIKPGSIKFGSTLVMAGATGTLSIASGVPSLIFHNEGRGEMISSYAGMLINLDITHFPGCDKISTAGAVFNGQINTWLGATGVLFRGLGRTSSSFSFDGEFGPKAAFPLSSAPGSPAGFGGAHVRNTSVTIRLYGVLDDCRNLNALGGFASTISDDTIDAQAVIARANTNTMEFATVVDFPPNVDVTTTDPNTRLAIVQNILLAWNTPGINWTIAGGNILNIAANSLGFQTTPANVQPQITASGVTRVISPIDGFVQSFVGSPTQTVRVNNFALGTLSLAWSGAVQTDIHLPSVGKREVNAIVDINNPALQQTFVPFGDIVFDTNAQGLPSGEYRLNLSTVDLNKFTVHLYSKSQGLLDNAVSQRFRSVTDVDMGGGVWVYYGLTAAIRGNLTGSAFTVVVNGQDFPVSPGSGSYSTSHKVIDKDTATVEVLLSPLGRGGTSVNIRSVFTDNNTVPDASALASAGRYGVVIGAQVIRHQVLPPRLIVRAGQLTNIRVPLNILVEIQNVANPNEIFLARLQVTFDFAKALTAITAIVAINAVPSIVPFDTFLGTTVFVDPGGRTVTRRIAVATANAQDIDTVEILCLAQGTSAADNLAHIQKTTQFVAIAPYPPPPLTLPDPSGPFDFDIKIGQRFTLVGPIRGIDFRNKQASRAVHAHVRGIDAENTLDVQELIFTVTVIAQDAFQTTPDFFVAINRKITPLTSLPGAGTSANPRTFDAIDADTVEILAKLKAIGFTGTATTVAFVRAHAVPDGDPMPAFPSPASIVSLTPQGVPILADESFLIGSFIADRFISLIFQPTEAPPAPPPVTGPVSGLVFRRDISKNRALRVKMDFFNASNVAEHRTIELVVKAQVVALLQDVIFTYANSRVAGAAAPVQAGGPNVFGDTITGTGTVNDPFIIKVDKPEQFQLFANPTFLPSTTTTPLALMQGEVVFDAAFVELIPPESDARGFGPGQRFNLIPENPPPGSPALKPPTGEEMILATGNTNNPGQLLSAFNRQSRPYHARTKGTMVGNEANVVERDVFFIVRDPSV